MMGDSRSTADGGFLFSPASLYPTPAAYVVDRAGIVLHTWSHTAHQPRPEDDPPNNLRGWNHVAVNDDGSLFAIVPLRALLKLRPDSELAWSADVAAHHDLAIDDSQRVAVLTEKPRVAAVAEFRRVILDNFVTLLDSDGGIVSEVSLYDVLRTDSVLRRLIDESTLRRSEEFERRGWPRPEDEVSPEEVRATRRILRSGDYEGEARAALSRLRALPGSPCDVMHTNTLEFLDAHPAGLWGRGALMLCMRELNTVAVIELATPSVRWSWGADDLSGPHQPTMMPDGNVLVFDNGVAVGRTRLVVVDPGTRQVVWSWMASPPEAFFCPLAGGCERMHDGSFLVTDSTAGRAFDLSADGQIIWQLTLSPGVYGASRGRASIYRMSAVGPDVVARLRSHRHATNGAPVSVSILAHDPLQACGS